MHDAVQNPDVSMTASQEGPNTQQTQSFSSLIDYNPHVDPANTAETSPKALEEANSPSSSSRAETLRLRLKVALYKVRTDQMNVPFHSLELSSGDTPMDTSNASESPPDKESLRQSPTASPKHPRNTSKSPALNPSPARSTSYPTTNLPPAPIPKLLPAPVLIPTSYSSRHIYAPHYHANRTPASSPPRAILSPERSLPSMTPAKSPTKKLVDERELTSSVVKGRAATGLLELRGSGAGEVVE
ncbi:hypothetical protein P152DRAFT_127328 [Eremomyces bilateralis CBS 781.70]|uniref:Uncharacterized protein n=1 Tax=Eremomyces bilateralis CBS 781.70 TaxID=1392243 RepID=A0A6G1GF52_9PEZI|nr:uncharacterized protein P152DRAFT_127328 [Eremomyces bilateralis CBS 781.70]KAF1816546.1 hypothetical protein P152DRAFT_127328 [Eremomyces bilateralis CBS 781.70]